MKKIMITSILFSWVMLSTSVFAHESNRAVEHVKVAKHESQQKGHMHKKVGKLEKQYKAIEKRLNRAPYTKEEIKTMAAANLLKRDHRDWKVKAVTLNKDKKSYLIELMNTKKANENKKYNVTLSNVKVEKLEKLYKAIKKRLNRAPYTKEEIKTMAAAKLLKRERRDWKVAVTLNKDKKSYLIELMNTKKANENKKYNVTLNNIKVEKVKKMKERAEKLAKKLKEYKQA